MTIKCKYHKEKDCVILNVELGDCEICEGDKVVWRCPNYIKERDENI
jgi:hypothetical protein